MFRRRFWIGSLVGLVIVGLLMTVGAYAIYRMGWSQGYWAGRVAAGAGESPPLPYAPYPYMARPFSLSAVLLIIGLFFLVVAVGKVIRLHFWRRMMRRYPPARAWRRYARHHHPHMAPWWDWQEQDEDEKTTEPPAEPQGAPAEATS